MSKPIMRHLTLIFFLFFWSAVPFFMCIEFSQLTNNYKEANVKEENKSFFIIDTDAGVDDAIAILYILGAEKLSYNIKVVGITCVRGNTIVNNVIINVLKTLKTAGRIDIPVYKGLNDALIINSEFDDYFGNDGFGDFEFSDPPPLSLIKKTHAVNALVEAVSSKPGQLDIICLGPLTNIAMAQRIYPDFLKNIKNIFVLGSSLEGIGNTKPGIEFNFYVDPEAAFIVFKAAQEFKKVITLVPWETVALRGKILNDWRKKILGSINSSAINLINKAEGKHFQNSEWWYYGDPILAAVSINSSIITSFEMHPISIEVCGLYSRGASYVDYNATNEISFVKIVKQIDIEMYKNMLIDMLK